MYMIQHFCKLSYQCMCTAAEGDQITVTVCHCTKQGVDLLFANSRVDHIAELEELLLGQPALLPVVNQSEGIHNGSQCSLMQLQIPPEQNLQAGTNLFPC